MYFPPYILAFEHWIFKIMGYYGGRHNNFEDIINITDLVIVKEDLHEKVGRMRRRKNTNVIKIVLKIRKTRKKHK